MAIASVVQQPKQDPGSGHVPTFLYAQVPDGLAMCGTQPCAGPRKAVA